MVERNGHTGSLCVVCAWRRNCIKKSMGGTKTNCPDFSRDLMLDAEIKEKEKKQDEN